NGDDVTVGEPAGVRKSLIGTSKFAARDDAIGRALIPQRGAFLRRGSCDLDIAKGHTSLTCTKSNSSCGDGGVTHVEHQPAVESDCNLRPLALDSHGVPL